MAMKKNINSMGRSAPLRVLAALMAAWVLPWPAPAQTAAPAAQDSNLFRPEFRGETTTNLGNFWDGVDATNDLRVYTANSLVLNDAGKMVDTPMSSCPNFVDMNDDGLNDLVVSDTQGFLWIYVNSGEKGAPKFTTGEFIPTFIGWGAKIHVYDWDGDGDNDVLFGTFYGDIGILENTGTRKQWKFTRRMGIPRYIDPQFGVEDPKDRLPTLMLGKQPMILGNYMSPWVVDWNNDNKPDLILGEGTYSANSVRLLLNAGSRNRPVFIEDRMFYLAYGEGFEQLTPAVVDYNGDGLPDLIVGTRTGHIRLYKGTQQAVEGKDMVAAIRGVLAPAVLEFDGFVKIAGKEVYDTMSFVYPCDWNDDGLFDLLLGSTQGKINIALNQGTKTEPKFPKVGTVKGTDTEKDMLAPANWMNGITRVFWHNFFGGYCNSALLFSAEKEVILRAGSQPITPVAGNSFMYFRYVKDYPGYTRNNLSWLLPASKSPTVEHVVGGRVIAPNCTFELKLKQQYNLSFSAVVAGKPVTWMFWAHEIVRQGTADVGPAYETRYVSDTIPPSVGWQKRNYRFRCPSTVQSNYNYHFSFRMPEGDVRFLLDDLSLTEVGR